MRLSQPQRSDARSLEDIVLQLASDKNQGSFAPVSGCSEDELHYLKNVGCFDIPPPHVLSALIDAYFTIFHPFFPVVQKSEFLQSIKSIEVSMTTSPNAAHHASPAQNASSPESAPRNSHLSLLLLQAVLFIAIGVVPSEVISAAGFTSRKQARHAYYLKARRLYDLDYDEDPIATIQALLLISQYYPSITERKHTWHWIHQAISLAQVSGLHRDPGNVPHRALWARIWWACIVRDRCNGLGTGRPLMINSLDCTTSMLVLDDVREEGDSEQDLEIKAIFIEFVKLCQIVEGIVTLRYSSSVTDAAPPDQLQVCEDALERWMRSLPPQAKRQDHLQAVSGNIGVATMYRAILHACLNTIRIALYQSLTLWNGAGDWTTTCQQKVEFAALDNTQLFTHLVNLDLGLDLHDRKKDSKFIRIDLSFV
ncbi:Fungal specific transcription factor domain-containing protein [Cladophialophora immunda]|nr:Fungal specific transcription factor domain-containing protein [Cladophialophora immunda]